MEFKTQFKKVTIMNKLLRLTLSIVTLISFANAVDVKNEKPNFGSVGKYEVTSEVDPNNKHLKFYYSPNHTKNAPVAIYCSPINAFKNPNLMKFIASQGYFVVEGQQTNNPYHYVNMMKEIVKKYHVDSSKVVLLGYSLGSSYIYETLKALKKEGYAQKKSGLVSLDGFFAKDMNAEDMDSLNTEVLLLMFGGTDGTPSKDGIHSSFQDPRIMLTLSRLLKKHNKVSLYPVEANDTHGYLAERGNSLEAYAKEKEDVVQPLHAFLHHILSYKDGVDYGEKMVMIGEVKYPEIMFQLKDKKEYQYPCKTKYFGGLDYCDPSHPRFKTQ